LPRLPRNLVLFADSCAIPVSSVLAYRKYAPRARLRPRLLSAKITRFLGRRRKPLWVSSVLAYRNPRARHRPRLLSAKITRFLDPELDGPRASLDPSGRKLGENAST
jgi:hypothetical protein